MVPLSFCWSEYNILIESWPPRKQYQARNGRIRYYTIFLLYRIHAPGYHRYRECTGYLYRRYHVYHVSMRWGKDRSCKKIHHCYSRRSRAGTQCLGDYRYGRSDSYFYPILISMFSRLFIACTMIFFSFSAAVFWLQKDLTNTVERLIPTVQSDNRVDYVNIAREIQFWLFVFVGIIAVAYIIYIGAKLLWAPGNTEEMTSAMKSIAYIVIGLAIIPFAYFIVQLIANIRIW